MVPGRLAEKNGYYYMVLSYTEKETGKRKQPWFRTGLPVKGNKKKAEAMLQELRRTFIIPTQKVYDGNFSPEMLFSDFMKVWFEIEKHSKYACLNNQILSDSKRKKYELINNRYV